MTDFYVDPGGAYISYKGVQYYRDGILYGMVLPESETIKEEHPIPPTLWSTLVIDYRKKSVIVQAIQLAPDNAEEIATWCGGLVVQEIDPEDDEKRYDVINIPTLEGVMRASQGDYVIKGVRGEFYPCKPEIFSMTFELA